jgi:TPR repeat protein
VPKDPASGLVLLQKAADKDYGPAIYEVALRRFEGRDLPKDPDKALSEMIAASILGSAQAQYYLGHRFEKGLDVPVDLPRARRSFNLCATQGIAACQIRLARLILEMPDRRERDYVQAVAWLQLADEQKNPEAHALAFQETAKLTPAQSKWVDSLKPQLVRK